jgi:hypothetical protein
MQYKREVTTVADMKQVHDFAVKWCDKFHDQKINYIELVDHYMADDGVTLGFKMDCGNVFSKRYGKAVNDYKELNKVIDEVNDIELLGSAIYSQWRYFNNWAYTGEEILEFKNRSWFILALSRLAMLSGKNPFIFEGTPKKVCIVSNNISYGPFPEPLDEVKQHITINAEGRVWFSAYSFGEGFNQHEKVRTKNYKIEKEVAGKVLNAVATYFSQGYDEIFATDIGDWQMGLTNIDDETYKFRGSLCANFEIGGTDLSDLIRDSLEMDDLYVFDGNCKSDKVNRITVDYHHVTRIKPKQSINDEIEYITWNYTEQLIVDRESQTIEHTQNIGTGCIVSRKYKVEGGVEGLLDNLDADYLFDNVVGNPPDVIETPNETKDYTITVDFKKNPQRVIQGSYDKNGLPDDWAEFSETVFDFMRFYGFGEILDPSVYEKVKRRKNDYIFCNVTFDEGYKSYYYLADDDSIKIGDSVLVPAGKDNHTAIVDVVNIEYFSEEEAPLPVGKTKHIIRKCTDDDFDPQKEV